MVFDNPAIGKVLEKSGFGELNPVQRKALNKGLLDKNNMVIAAPTASGKTLVAEIAALDTIKENKKVVYIVPLRALATEKYQEFKEKYEPLGIRIAISIGDLDSSDPWLANYDLIIVTSEKFDSLLRHGINWVESIGLVVADEIHLLNDPGRGPTLEVVLTRLRQFADPKILALSATIYNYDELSEWLNAKSVKSDYRPVKLYRGICFDNKIDFIPKKSLKMKPDEANLKGLIEQVLAKKKQALVFISTMRGAESAAEKIAKTVKDKLSPEEKKKLNKVSEKILGVLGHPTIQCHRLSGCVKDGVAFHHAGLTNKQRNLIEESFKSGLIKAITATPTLAAGINLPSWRVIVKDLKRFDSGSGMDYIPVLEIQQMMGRAGRPKYDSEGEAILLANNKRDAGYAWDNYIRGDPERIASKLGMEPVLRTHVLSLIASGVTPTREDLFNFFSKTFYAYQYKDMGNIKKILERIISLLEEFRFITTGETGEEGPFKSGTNLLEEQKAELKPTRIGKRVSELYIDPLTANHLIEGLGVAMERRTSEFGYLQMISNTLEMMPLPNIRKSDMEDLNEIVVKEEKNLIQKPPNPWDIEYDDFLRSLKTALLLREWCEEAGEDQILDRFAVTPGELRVRLNNTDWLLYATQELGLLLGYMDILKDIRKARLRIKYGVRKELLPLVKLRGIGRVKARLLYNSGLRSLDSLRKIPLTSLERIIGPKTARQVKQQLG
ncbi:MAG: DEAD/DEAH box helicase [Candidatus Aenigmatarchaeota archaeon]|nr:MAG: DEAD/DEAH box helicase [Candidatus Aenigmarchaeota archaeon]